MGLQGMLAFGCGFMIANPFFFSRRRSFHDLASLQNMHVTAIERMRVDVELCGQLLIMIRRDEHLRNVLSCLHVSAPPSVSI